MNNFLPSAFVPPHEMLSLPENTPILLAFSGGPDSAALLSMLVTFSKEKGAPLYAAHLDHMLREDEHERDRAFCERTAKAYGVTFFSESANIRKIAEETGESEELAARRVRYDFFMRIMEEYSIPILVTAHNADDNLETVLLNLTRGSGLRGMCGIPHTRCFGNSGDKYVARPIITMTKAEILEYCEENGVEYVFDSTNALPDYSRNRIRLNVLDELRKINPKVASVTLRTCENLRDDESFLFEKAKEFYKSNPLPTEIANIVSLPRPIRRRVIMMMADELEAFHIQSIEKMCEKPKPNAEISLPQRMKARTDGKYLYIERNEKKEKAKGFYVELLPGENKISDRLSLYVSFNDINIYKSETRTTIASDKIKGKLFARNRESGDRILVNGMHKSVKKLMCDAKIPLEMRDILPVVCDSDGIVFIPYVATRDGMSAKNCADVTYLTLVQG